MAAMPIVLAIVSQGSDTGPLWSSCFLVLLYGEIYRIRGNFRGLPIFAVFRGQYESAKIKIAKYFPISVKGSSLVATSFFAAVTVVSFASLNSGCFRLVP